MYVILILILLLSLALLTGALYGTMSNKSNETLFNRAYGIYRKEM